MTKKVHIVKPLTSVARAASIMEKYSIGCLPVVTDKGKLEGIITSRDIRRTHPNRLIADAMTKRVITVSPKTSIWDAKQLIEENNVERLVVVQNGFVVGIITKSEIIATCNRYIDDLTGLYKPEFFYTEALKLLEKSAEITVIFMDLDNFGMINKKYGHTYGDDVICRIAQILREMVSSNTDILCRYAGDEFAIATLSSLQEAKLFATRLLKAIDSEKWNHDAKITASIGIAGGRRKIKRENSKSSYHTIRNLVNMASLASTKAKSSDEHLVVADGLEEMV